MNAQDALFDMEAGNETEPTFDDLAAIESGDALDEWIDAETYALPFMGSEDEFAPIWHRVSAEVAAERSARFKARAEADKARRAQFAKDAAKLKASKPYALMGELLTALKGRGVYAKLADKTVTVYGNTHVKGHGTRFIPMMAVKLSTRGKLRVTSGDVSELLTMAELLARLTAEAPERMGDVMPRKYRHVMRTHRNKNKTPGDITGERATRGNSDFTDADMDTFPEFAMVAGPARKTSGKVSRQGERGMTADERRASDRERLRVWRERKRAEKLAAEAATA